ncbi:MAG TPA: hypothetical protein VLI41_11090 [Phenylobacterium sp.]|uniref:hypothetical protein n=1 Tax=Phenylobacterium sp. TaxID=1871053 RepID=UPI002CC8DC50|nr:hypothetical protein [Phenylobacterium sp.]HSV03736.1 hypothetical protein [Phenylobacterium sp.]
MPALAFALALLLADQPDAAAAVAQATDPAPAAEAPRPAGAPKDDYQFVAWCYGALRGYLDLHDQVMPEVTRIESEFRRPGSKLSDDLKVYAEAQRQGHKDLGKLQAAMTAAEKASLKPINTLGAAAVAKGHAMWTVTAGVTKARLAQEWMSWEPPRRCVDTAEALQKRALLMGPAFKVNVEAETAAPEAAPAAEAAAPKPADPPAADAPPAADKPADAAASADKPN